MWVAPTLTSGLGNRLFQFAAAAGAAEKWGRELVFYMPACKESPHGALATIFRLFPGIRIIDQVEPHTELKEPPRLYYEYIPVGPAPPSNTLIHGFRQSPYYFPQKFEPDWDSALGGAHIRGKIHELSNLKTNVELVRTYAIHVRLGDYRHLKHHQVDLGAYYTKALERVPAGSRLHLFSDEPDLCLALFRDVITSKNLEYTRSKTYSDIESLYEMSLCLGGTITANSTFSWWGAWFAHMNGAAWATYPDSMGTGQPEPSDLVPSWGTILGTKN